jgi:hypothetical protein
MPPQSTLGEHKVELPVGGEDVLPPGHQPAPPWWLGIRSLDPAATSGARWLGGQPLIIVTFAGSRQDTNLTNRLAKPSAGPQVYVERLIQRGQSWTVQPYTSGTTKPSQDSTRPRGIVIKDFLTLTVEILAPRQGHPTSRFPIDLRWAHQLPSMSQDPVARPPSIAARAQPAAPCAEMDTCSHSRQVASRDS